MTTQEVKRKLTAILSADVKGYSRLMSEDEAGTIRTLNAYKEVITGLILQHHGRVVDAPGDNLLAELASVVDAVQCAVEIQKELKTRNARLPENRRMEFRIGINLGDVVEEEGKIFGDGVNIAARLESLSEAGGICISGKTYDEIKNKLPLGYKYLGEQTVKNISEPIRTYQVLMGPETAGKVIVEKKARPRQWQRFAIGLLVTVIVVVVAIVIWKFYVPSAPQPEVASKERITSPQSEKPSATIAIAPAPSGEPKPKEKGALPSPQKVTKPAPPPPLKEEVASREKMAFPLPDVPSIAVMPFVNMSGDPKQEFFSDGITEEIITALSKVRDLFVISRQSTFSYKGKPVKVKQVSEELGVQYVLEGSVRKEGDRVRITAQLIDALTGNHVWAERYERDLKNIFALQDEITIKIVTSMRVKLIEGEQALTMIGKLRTKPRLDCYMKILEGFNYFQSFNIEATRVARRIAEETITMCPEVPMAYVLMGFVHQMENWQGIGKSREESIGSGIEMARKALAMDDSMSMAHVLLSLFYIQTRDYEKAIAEAERAVALDPGGSFAHECYANSLNFVGRSEEAIPMFQKAVRLNPLGMTGLYLNFGHALRMTGRLEEAISAYKKSLQRAPQNILAHVALTGTYSLMGREEDAHAEATEVLRINPKFSVDYYTKIAAFKDQVRKDEFINALRKAGLK